MMPARNTDQGFTLVGLLAVMAISLMFLAVVAPSWNHLMTRNKEEELIFRGESYKFAIELYQKQYNKLPTRLDELIKTRKIRKLYLDPVTGGEFELIVFTGAGKKRESELAPSQRQSLRGTMPGGSSMGIMGVVSTSDKVALRPYKDKEKYNEWEFVAGEKDQQGEGQEQPGAEEQGGSDERG